MIRHATVFTISAALIFGLPHRISANDDDQVAARAAALDLAGAWSNDGFKTRDGYVSGDLKAGETRVVQVNLYAGNQYWFTAATLKGAKVAIAVYDESGKPMATEPFQDETRAAAGFAPQASGPYWVKISIPDGKAASFAFVYSYK